MWAEELKDEAPVFTFLKEAQTYADVLTAHNWSLITRHFGVLNKPLAEIDAELTAEAKEKFIEQCKRGLAKQTSE